MVYYGIFVHLLISPFLKAYYHILFILPIFMKKTPLQVSRFISFVSRLRDSVFTGDFGLAFAAGAVRVVIIFVKIFHRILNKEVLMAGIFVLTFL